MKNGKVIGYAEIAGFAGVDDNGLSAVEGPIVTVNTAMTAPNLKHQSRIAGRRFTMIEEEDTDAKVQGKRMVAYRKEIQGVQEPMEAGRPNRYGKEPDAYEPEHNYSEPEKEKANDWLTKNIKELAENAWGRSNLACGLSIGAIAFSILAIAGLVAHLI
jgi:hypothetical protein